MSRHRKASGRRGVAPWLIITAVVVIAVIAAVAAWLQLRETSDSQGAAASRSCVAGERELSVLADPSIAEPLAAIAEQFTAAGPVVRDECVTVAVEAATAEQAAAVLTDPELGDDQRPAMWVPADHAAVDALRAADASAVRPDGRSLVSSPVVLAVPADAADDFAGMAWSDLPARQSDPATALALPAGATTTVLTEIAALAGPDGEVTAAQVHGPDGAAALRALRAEPAGRFPDADRAREALLTGADDALATPMTAQAVYAAGTTSVVAVRPDGPTPLADYPAVLTFAAADDDVLGRAGAMFADYVRTDEVAELLASGGFLPGIDPETGLPADQAAALGALPADEPSLAVPGDVLARPSAEVVTAVAPVARTAGGATTTVLLDVSGSMSWLDGGRPRIDVVTDLLEDRIEHLGDRSNVGLWSYSAFMSDDRPERLDVSTGPLEETIAFGGTRREGLLRTLAAAVPVSSTYTYRSLEAVYAAAVDGYVPDQRNSVLLVTDGPNDDPAHLSTSRLLATLAATADPDRPVAIDVLVISPNPDIASLIAVAEQTGGELVEVPDSTDPALAAAIDRLLG